MLYDKDIREPLFEFLEETYGKVRFLEEQVMGQSRADIVMVVPDALYGIEIKSDADSYVRLERQIQDYDLYYDYNYVVVGTKHGANIAEHVPEHWGIITVEQTETGIDFYRMREPELNTGMQWTNKIEILWRPELAHIQALNEMPAYKAKSKRFVADKIVEMVPKDYSFQRNFSSVITRRSGRQSRRIVQRTDRSREDVADAEKSRKNKCKTVKIMV